MKWNKSQKPVDALASLVRSFCKIIIRKFDSRNKLSLASTFSHYTRRLAPSDGRPVDLNL
jgi:hypothetical protein